MKINKYSVTFLFINVLFFVFNSEASDEDLSDSIISIPYKVYPLVEIKYGKERDNLKASLLEEVINSDGPISYVGKDTSLILVDNFGIIYRFDKNGKLLVKNEVKSDILNLTAEGKSIYTFNGKEIVEYNIENLSLVKKTDIGLPGHAKILHNRFFFYSDFLFVLHFNLFSQYREVIYIYGYKTNKLEKKNYGNEIFTNSMGCKKYYPLKEILFSKDGYSGYLGQSEKFIISYKYLRKNMDIKKRQHLITIKESGEQFLLRDFDYQINTNQACPFTFITSNVAVFHELIYKSSLPYKIIIRFLEITNE